jgi:hypothetical protein
MIVPEMGRTAVRAGLADALFTRRLRRVARQPKLFVIGSADDLR